MATYSLKTLRRLELHAAFAERPSSLAIEDHAAGVVVQPVDDAGPQCAVAERQLLAEAELQGVHQRAGPVPLRRVHHHVPAAC